MLIAHKTTKSNGQETVKCGFKFIKCNQQGFFDQIPADSYIRVDDDDIVNETMTSIYIKKYKILTEAPRRTGHTHFTNSKGEIYPVFSNRSLCFVDADDCIIKNEYEKFYYESFQHYANNRHMDQFRNVMWKNTNVRPSKLSFTHTNMFMDLFDIEYLNYIFVNGKICDNMIVIKYVNGKFIYIADKLSSTNTALSLKNDNDVSYGVIKLKKYNFNYNQHVVNFQKETFFKYKNSPYVVFIRLTKKGLDKYLKNYITAALTNVVDVK